MLTGLQLRLLRQAKGLVQKEMAAKMNIAQQRLSALEKRTDKISDSHSYKAFRALRCTEQEVFQFINNLPPQSKPEGK